LENRKYRRIFALSNKHKHITQPKVTVTCTFPFLLWINKFLTIFNFFMMTKKISVYSYVSEMLSVKTLGVNTPLHIAETNKRIAHIEATRNKTIITLL